MENFKIIAIKTGNKPNVKFFKNKENKKLDPFKNLEENTIYCFYNQYKFPNQDLNTIDYRYEEDIDLYQLKISKNDLSVNINAIVGSNGSGKSSLVELMYWANYNIGCVLKLLSNEKGTALKAYDFLDLELLYTINKSSMFKIIFKDGEIIKYRLSLKDAQYSLQSPGTKISEINDLSNFFYTIVINYSHYALNSKELGDWIIPLFHKNDGYQTPIVLNPMRKEGNININVENYLLKRRLQANLLEYVPEGDEKNSLRNLVNGKIAEKLVLTFNPRPYTDIEAPIPKDIRSKLLEAFEEHFQLDISVRKLNDDYFTNITLGYIYQKLIKISDIYKPFYRYREKNSHGKSIKYVNAFIRKIKESDSHIIFKVKGAILYLKHFEKIFGNKKISSQQDVVIHLNELSNTIKEINEIEKFWVNTFMMAPPSFFNVEIIPADNSLFSSLSSGEKQRIHSISSIVYHLINLNSVEQQKQDKKSKLADEDTFVHYNYINIILDEIELYYHPEWQRNYIDDLIQYIGKINPANLQYIKGINITFLTHSPYILSDIPEMFVLKLEEGKPLPQMKGEKTFGANIHDLLANEFFMSKGYMGNWAKMKIEQTIKYLNFKYYQNELEKLNAKEKKILESGNRNQKASRKGADSFVLTKEDREYKVFLQAQLKLDISGIIESITYHEKIIDLIGEPVIKNKMKNMFSEILSDNEKKQAARRQIVEIAKSVGLNVNIN